MEHPPEVIEAMRLEAERTEMKQLAHRLLREAFVDVLPSEDFDRRLAQLNDTRFVSDEEYNQLVQEHPDEADAEGIMRVEVQGKNVRRYAVVRQRASRAENLHTLMHEGTHLMAPESHLVFDPMRDEEDQVYSVYLGAVRADRFVRTGEVDPLSIPWDRPKGRGLFWEAFTDWNALEVLADQLTPAEQEGLSTSGYVERHYLAYLVDHVPNRAELVRALREANVQGSEDPLRRYFYALTGQNDDTMYEELLDVLAIPMDEDNWERRSEAWMAVVDKYVGTKI